MIEKDLADSIVDLREQQSLNKLYRVRDVLAEMKALPDTKKEELKAWADGRKLSGAALLASESWLSHVEDWLAEYGGAS